MTAISSVPASYANQYVTDLIRILLPLSLVFSLAFVTLAYFYFRQRQSIKTELRTALKRDEFYLEYQPIIDLHSGECIGAEALLRAIRKGKVSSPASFIPMAEKSGMITEITSRVLTLLERDFRETLHVKKSCHIGINLSSADLNSEKTVGKIRALLDNSKLPSSNFLIEATESGLLNARVAKDIIRQIRELGIKVAIDDFGTGYSSLSYLSSYELDYLKIDKSFVDAVGTGSVQSEVVYHIIEMAKTLDLKLIAEGVETEKQAAILVELGVHYGQGWLFGKPMRAGAFMDYYTQQHGVVPVRRLWQKLNNKRF